MPLGPDASGCTDEFVAAMRNRLDQLDPPAGKNVDLPDVRANLGALGAAVYQVLKGPGRAQTVTDPSNDATFWAWVTSLTDEVSALRAWQQGVREAVTAWSPADLPGQQLKTALLELPQSGTAPRAPTQLIGKIQ